MSNIYDGAICEYSLRLKDINVSGKSFIVDIWEAPKYVSDSEFSETYKLLEIAQ